MKGTLHRITILTCATIGALCGNIARQLNVHFGAFILRSTPSLKRVAKCGVPCDCRLTNLILIVIAQRRLICIHTIVALVLIKGARVAYEHVVAIVSIAQRIVKRVVRIFIIKLSIRGTIAIHRHNAIAVFVPRVHAVIAHIWKT